MESRDEGEREGNETRGYDPDRHKRERLPPLEAIATFLALVQMGASIDLAMNRDPYERWRRAKGYTA